MNSSTQKLTAYTAIGLIVLIIAAIVYVQFGRGQSTMSADGSLDLSQQPSIGQEGAPVQIALFEDFKCPACRNFTETVLPQIERELVESGQAEVFFVNFPIPLGPDSVTAAIASECVYEQDPAAFWDYKTYVFRSQGPESQEWATPALLTDLAREYVPSVDADQLRTCIDERQYAERVEAERRMGAAAGVRGTPSVFVNGERVERSDFNSVNAAVQSALGQTN